MNRDFLACGVCLGTMMFWLSTSTYLLAKDEVVATCKLVGINCTRMESLLRRLFAGEVELTLPL